MKSSVHAALSLIAVVHVHGLSQPMPKTTKVAARSASSAANQRVIRVTIQSGEAPRKESANKFGRQSANPKSMEPKGSVLAPAFTPSPDAPSRTAPPSIGDDVDDNPYASEYWYDPRIHNQGNIGFGGRMHALMAPLATAIIDRLSYRLPEGGFLDVRKKILSTLPKDATVLDLACGTGFSTAPGATGLDTSNEMLDMARCRRPDCKFVFGNAESYGDDASFDIVTLMFATHEMPAFGRRRVLRNAMRLARKEVVVVDIDPDFEETLKKKPFNGATFLSGEPYVLDYLRRMDDDVKSCAPFRFALNKDGASWKATREVVLKGHVVAWRITRE